MAESDILINIKLSLENKISYYLNNIHEIWDNNTPSWTDAVTLHQLLIHAAGIPSYTCLPEFDHQRKYSPTELISLFKSYPLEFTPGTAFSYSNSGYALLGKIIEKITAMPLDCFLEKSLFVPLGMHATSLPVEGTVPDLKENHLKYKHLARGYAFDPGKINPKIKEVDQYTSMQIPGAAGGMISSTTDLLTWNQALYNGKIVPKILLDLMLQPYIQSEIVDEYYGYGIEVKDNPKLGVYYRHPGGIPGFRSSLTYIPSRNISIVILENMHAEMQSLHAEIVELQTQLPEHLSSFKKYNAVEKILERKYPCIVDNKMHYQLTLLEASILSLLESI